MKQSVPDIGTLAVHSESVFVALSDETAMVCKLTGTALPPKPSETRNVSITEEQNMWKLWDCIIGIRQRRDLLSKCLLKMVVMARQVLKKEMLV